MLNERKLTEKELDKRAETIQGLLSNKRTLVKKYGKDAEKVMYGIATKQAKSKVENMNKEKIKELIQLALQKEAETVPTIPHSTTDLTKTVDTGFSGRADYGEEDKALGQEDELEMKGLEEQVDKFNLDVFGYETKYFKVCPGAKTFMDKVMAKGYGDKSDDKEKVIRLAKLHDLLFIRELKALKDPEYAADVLSTAKLIAAEIKGDVDSLDIPIEDVSYIDNHIEIIKDQAKKADSRITEGHGLSQKDIDVLDLLVRSGEDDYLSDDEVEILKFIIKSNILQDKTKDLSKGKVNEGHMMSMDDLDVGHIDNEPRMLKKELARAGKMIQMLYRAIDKYDGKGEVDFPQWWQSKIIKANDYLDSAFDYLDGEESVAKIDAMIDVVGEEISSKNYAKGIEVVRDTLSKEGGAAGLEPLVKELVKLGFKKSDVIELLKNMTSVKKHRDGDYILLPLEEKVEGSEAIKLKKIEKELNKASKMHKSQADRIGKLVKETLTEMDGGTLFDYFNKEYVVDDHFHSDDSYIVKREPSGKDQYVIFDYDKDKDQFQIRQMGGYRINQKDAIKAGMRETGITRVAGIDSYMVDGNYSPTPISIEGLKDIVDHVMGGLSREAAAQQDFYARRGPTSGTIDEKIRLAVEKKLTAAEKDKKEDIIKGIAKQKGGKKKLEPVDYAVATDRAKKLAEEFKVGQKVTYLGNPGEITKINKEVTGDISYNVSYDKGTGKTKASNIYNKDGEIKAV